MYEVGQLEVGFFICLDHPIKRVAIVADIVGAI